MYGATRKKALNTPLDHRACLLPSQVGAGRAFYSLSCGGRTAATEIWARAFAAQKHKALLYGNQLDSVEEAILTQYIFGYLIRNRYNQ